MVYQPKNPVGYRSLITWRQAGEIYLRAKDFARNYLDRIKDQRLVNHIVNSARSVQRNIEEGYKRATTKEYVVFLGFSRGSLEELKRDFEELLREYREGIRREKEGGRRGKGEMGELRELVDLIYGEDCMLGRQILALERKMRREKTLPQSEMIRDSWKEEEAGIERFWRYVREKHGLVRGEDGIFRKVEKGEEGKEKGVEGK